jgi:hypothetical protein
MISTRQSRFLLEVTNADVISPGTLAYIEARAKNRFYDYVLRKFLEKEENDGFTKADLARRIGRRPEVITRLLGAPGNWTIETAALLLVGICGEELEPQSRAFAGRPKRNFGTDDLLNGKKAAPLAKEPAPKEVASPEVIKSRNFVKLRWDAHP